MYNINKAKNMNNLNKQFLTIKAAAQYLGLSEATLRRWDNAGSFKATFRSSGGHRYYSLSDLERKTKGIFRIAEEWARATEPFALEQDFYCSTSDRFKARYERMANRLSTDSTIKDIGSLVSSAAGEIGNNSFDHNLGNWPDIMGTFFAYDIGKRRIVLADRGVGILATLSKVVPALKGNKEALRIAFTEIITGRAPEHRGNGLKYVRDAIIQANANLFFQSGDAVLEIKKGNPTLIIKNADLPIRGCLAMIEF